MRDGLTLASEAQRWRFWIKDMGYAETDVVFFGGVMRTLIRAADTSQTRNILDLNTIGVASGWKRVKTGAVFTFADRSKLFVTEQGIQVLGEAALDD